MVINNIDNLEVINSNEVSLLPWYDTDNPIIMFEYNDKYDKSVDKTNALINKFGKKRLKPWSKYITYVDFRCKMQIWDTYMEYYILKKYCGRYDKDIRDIHRYICKVLKNPCCTDVKLHPVYIPQPVAIEFSGKAKAASTGVITTGPEKDKVITTGPEKDKVIIKDNVCNDIIKDVTDKVNIVNDLLELK